MAYRSSRSGGRAARPAWRYAAVGALAAFLLPLTTAGEVQARPAPEPEPATAVEEKTEQELRDAFAEDENKPRTFWLRLGNGESLDEAAAAKTKTAKARSVLEEKSAYAEQTQAGLVDFLKSSGVDHTSFWIDNSVKVTGDAQLLEAVAERDDVKSIEADDEIRIEKPLEASAEPKVDGIEWNVDRVNAPQVWNGLEVRGEGIVVANIDTGVQYDHPALKGQYRGNKGDGSFDHNYNFYDPANVCAGDDPCDNQGHGTHTMGTMVGDDGGDNKIGVTPGAKWIAAKGCESGSCSRTSLLAAAQWIVAPTDLTGANPKPELAPDVVNNSWGSSASDEWYKESVNAWRAAGIFPSFSAGNSGSACNTTGSPGDYPVSYASGATDSSDKIASFSSRGSRSSEIKPNLAAPGVNVRSSIPGGGYNLNSGTSMAAPHTTATVALMWSAAPALVGDIAGTEAILDETAIDTEDLTCGGTVDDNNVYGEGRLNAYTAVLNSPRGSIGSLSGTVTSGGGAVGGATVKIDGPLHRTLTTAADGTYTLPALSVGDYDVTVSKFGFVSQTKPMTITEGEATTLDFAVEQAASAKLSGTVSSRAGPAAGSTVALTGTPVTTTTDAAGGYEVTVPVGEYEVTATAPAADRCADKGRATAKVDADTSVDIALPERTDSYGYACAADSGTFAGGEKKLDLSGDTAVAVTELPFPFPLYGKTYTSTRVGVNGMINFETTTISDFNTDLPSSGGPQGYLAPFWDDFWVTENSGVYTSTAGTFPNRTFTVEWRNVEFDGNRDVTVTFSATIGEDGSVVYDYKDIGDAAVESGSSATIGMENATGTTGFRYGYNSAGAVGDGDELRFRTTRTGVVLGRITDANDGGGVPGATVSLTGDATAEAVTARDGHYAAQLPPGERAVSVSAATYHGASGQVTVEAGKAAAYSAVLDTGRVRVGTESFTLAVPDEQQRERTLELANDGSPTPYTVSEKASWLTVSETEGDLGTGASKELSLAVDTAGQEPGAVLREDLVVASQSGRAPQITVPVTVVVPRYQTAVDAGLDSGRLTDALGDTWTPDQEYDTGGYGYQGASSVKSTRKPIAGAADPALYQTARQGMYQYVFDGLPDGTYTVELGFAELTGLGPDRRVFDVMAEGETVYPSVDISLLAGPYAALTKTVTVTVDDGQLNLRFVGRSGYEKPLVNLIRVTDRPDLAS